MAQGCRGPTRGAPSRRQSLPVWPDSQEASAPGPQAADESMQTSPPRRQKVEGRKLAAWLPRSGLTSARTSTNSLALGWKSPLKYLGRMKRKGHRGQETRQTNCRSLSGLVLGKIVPAVAIGRVPGVAFDVRSSCQLISWIEQKDPRRLIHHDFLNPGHHF